METFILPVEYNGKEFEFETSLQRFGYVYKFHVDVNGKEIIFEPDEEKNFRAIIPFGESMDHETDVELLKAIAETLHELGKS
jgi:hypothetical protein